MHDSCDTVLLGHSKYCHIAHCSECEAYHLHIGPMTLHLKEDVFENICEVIVSVHMNMNKNRISSHSNHSIHNH